MLVEGKQLRANREMKEEEKESMPTSLMLAVFGMSSAVLPMAMAVPILSPVSTHTLMPASRK